MPEFSIIIPCFNSEKTLLKAIASITAQHNDDCQIIIVNDASTDSSEQLVKEYVQAHPLEKIVLLSHNANKGVSTSRNDGIDKTVGDYVMFLDADDELDADCLHQFLYAIKQTDADLICSNIRLHCSDGRNFPQSRGGKKQSLAVFSPQNIETFTEYLPYFDSSCAKLFRRSLLQLSGLRFKPDLPFGEDTLFTNSFALRSQRIAILPDYCGYHYQLHEESCSARANARTRLSSLRQLLVELNKEAPMPLKRILLRKSREYIWTIRKFGKQERHQLLSELRHDQELLHILDHSFLSFGKLKQRLLWRLLKSGLDSPLSFW